MSTKSKILMCCVVGLWLTGCAVLEQAVQTPSVNVNSVEFRQVNMREGMLEARITISNPNPFSLPVKSVAYRLNVNDRELLRSSLALDSKLPAQGSVQATVPITLRIADLFEGINQILTRRQVSYQLRGDVDLGVVTVPYSKQGAFTLR